MNIIDADLALLTPWIWTIKVGWARPGRPLG